MWTCLCRPGEDTEVDASTGQPVTTVTSAAAVRSWWSIRVKSAYLRVGGWYSRYVGLGFFCDFCDDAVAGRWELFCCAALLTNYGKWHAYEKKKTVPVGTIIMEHNGTSSSYGLVDWIGLWSAWFSFLSSERFCIFGLHGVICLKFLCYILYYTF